MDNKKFEQLIDLIINENEEQARALFHDIVVEKSREIYEHLMDEDTLEENLYVEPTDSSEPPVNASGQAAGLLDEIEMEEQGMNEEDDEMDLDDMDDEDTEIMDLDSDEEDMDSMDDMDDEGSVEDRVVDIEDKVDNLERLMAEFEEIMNGGYSSDLSEFILDHPQIKLWTHGHTHEDFDYLIGSTRIVCNPRGYINYEASADKFTLKTVEI